jgi:hypothetical protein
MKFSRNKVTANIKYLLDKCGGGTPVIPELRRQNQEDLKFEVSLGYISKTLPQKTQNKQTNKQTNKNPQELFY